MRRSLEERLRTPGEAETRYYLARLGWVSEEDREGGEREDPRSAAAPPPVWAAQPG